MSTWQGTARSLVRRLVGERTLVLALATVILVVVGVIAVITDAYELVLLCILTLQATIVGYLLTAPDAGSSDDAATRAALDRASARTLADLAHARQSILDAIAQLESAQIDPRAK
jgi:NAD/NADP transhydrogenase beta subunit